MMSSWNGGNNRRRTGQDRRNYRHTSSNDTPSHSGGGSSNNSKGSSEGGRGGGGDRKTDHHSYNYNYSSSSSSSSKRGSERGNGYYRKYGQDRMNGLMPPPENRYRSRSSLNDHAGRRGGGEGGHYSGSDSKSVSGSNVATPSLASLASSSGNSSSYYGSSSKNSGDNDSRNLQRTGNSTPRINPIDHDGNDVHAKAAEEEFDRQFYLGDDDEFVVDATDKSAGRFLFESNKTKEREADMERRRQQDGGGIVTRATTQIQNLRDLKRSELNDDQNAWEENRLLSSGAALQGERSLDIKTEDDTRITLLVHQVKPPFLDGRVSFSTIRDAVPTVRDASSDFAKMAREGSDSLRRLRDKKEKNAMRQKFWELGGSRMGNAMGVENSDQIKKKEENEKIRNAESEDVGDDGEIDYKKSSGFASHLKKKGDGPVSKFAKTKSIRQQREYLPVFTVRDRLLDVIRENSVIIVVGKFNK